MSTQVSIKVNPSPLVQFVAVVLPCSAEQWFLSHLFSYFSLLSYLSFLPVFAIITRWSLQEGREGGRRRGERSRGNVRAFLSQLKPHPLKGCTIT